jgi:hypothetical protein
MVDVTIDIADLPLGRSRIVEAAGKRTLPSSDQMPGRRTHHQ